MDWGQVHSLVCPSACTTGEFLVALLPHRPMFLCYCNSCKAIWFEGPDGSVEVSHQEVHRLRQLRSRYLSGELRG
jgi:hypothetical protein